LDYRLRAKRRRNPSERPTEDENMVRTKALKATLLSALLVLPALTACTVTTQGGQAPPPAAAPPPPATTAPPPATTPPPAATTPAPAPTSGVSMKGDSVSLPGNIVFDNDKATLKQGAGSEVVLDQLKSFLDQNPQVTKLRIEGHTDNHGTLDHNIQLSGQRALTIKNYLISKGTDKNRLIAVGFGPNKPIADNSTEEGRAQNRRTEFKIAELKGKPYLGLPVDGGGKVFE
jgi:OOP family OmpA-OmpF porin